MNSNTPNILFVDDEDTFLKHLISRVEKRAPELVCHGASSEAEAIMMAKRFKPEVVVLDLTIDTQRGPESGFQLISKFHEFSGDVRVIVLTGETDSYWGIRCVNSGAASFLTKPVEIEHLIALINDGVTVAQLMRKNSEDSSHLEKAMALLGLSTKSEKMAKALEEIAISSSTRLPVLLCGETGVGKGVIAQAMHRASQRSSGPFVRVQPGFGSHDLIISELFGHTKGAYTGANEARKGQFEEANGGTLFLDEVDALPQQTQIVLLNVLQEKEFQKIGSTKKIHSDFRLISATNTPIEMLIDKNCLRMDFYHRMAHAVIHIPPLRERRADIPGLAQEFVSRLATNNKDNKVWGLKKDAVTWLSSQPWPGNVRELEGVIERGYAQAKYYGRGLINLSDLQKPLPQEVAAAGSSLTEQLRVYELTLVCAALMKNGHNYSVTARALGIDRKRLKRILARAEVSL